MSKQIKQYLIALLTLGLIFLANSIIWAWTAPTADPPSSNVAAPINVSATAQTKSGNLNIGSGLNYWITKVGDSFALRNNSGQTKFILGQDGHVGIGVTAPSVDLEVAGKIKMNTQTTDGDSDTTAVTKGYMNSKIGSNPPTGFNWFTFGNAGRFLKEGAYTGLINVCVDGPYYSGETRISGGIVQTRAYIIDPLTPNRNCDSGWVNGDYARCCSLGSVGFTSNVVFYAQAKSFEGGVRMKASYGQGTLVNCSIPSPFRVWDDWKSWEYPSL